jgi:glycosyltransferase involved in cell wall biosynthesis
MRAPPLVSVITPSFNAARFLEETIQSVLAQDYPYIEYIVMDGGSTDGSLNILRSYADRLTYSSGADEGAADAINNGFAKARGEILAWLGADDTYLPGAVSKAVAALNCNPDAAAVYGEGYWTDAQGQVLGSYPTEDFDPNMFARECCICQPACFFRRDAVEAVGMLNPALRSSFDYDLWIRLTKRYRFVHLPEYLASSRMHRENKTLGQRRTVFTESIALLGQHFGYVPVKWVYGYLSFLRDRRDQFFEPLRHSIPAYLMALPVGLGYNPAHPFMYMAEWIAAVKMSKLKMFVAPGERPDAGHREGQRQQSRNASNAESDKPQ